MKTLIAIPCMDMLHTDFARSLMGLQTEGEVRYAFAQCSLIYSARNTLARIAVDEDYDRVLWLDSDMRFGPETFKQFADDLESGKDFVTALCVTRKPPITPTAYKSMKVDYSKPRPVSDAVPIDGWPEDEAFEVAGCGFAAVMMTVDLLKRIMRWHPEPFTPMDGFGEDLSFCRRATKLDTKLWCDPRIKIGHVGLAVYEPSILENKWKGS